MVQKVAQKLRFCQNCNRETVHQRNTKEMSWVIHILLAILTAGLWLVVWLFLFVYHGLTKPIAVKWVCADCGGKGASPSTHVKCPDCRELVLMDARKCKHCGCALIPQA